MITWTDDLAVLRWPWPPEDDDGLADDGESGDDDAVAAILAPLSVIAIWWVSTHGKGAAALRLVAWGSAIVVVLVLVSFKDPHAAGAVVAGWFSGISAAITGLGHFLTDVFG